MNTTHIKRKTRIWRLQLSVWLLKRSVENHDGPAVEYLNLFSRYQQARSDLGMALIQHAERRMNRRVF